MLRQNPCRELPMNSDVNTSAPHAFPYDEADRDLLIAHIRKHFGVITGIGHTQLPSGRALDLLVVTPPSRRHVARLFSTPDSSSTGEETMIVTLGAGACPMNVPDDSALPSRAEYLIRLPSDWNVQSDEEECSWPSRLLLNIASLPDSGQEYNSSGHTFSFRNDTPFAGNTRLCAALLTGMSERDGLCRLTGNASVAFHEVIPLYAEELTFVKEHGAVALIEEFIRYSIPRIVTPQRPNAALLFMHRNNLLHALNTMKEKDFNRLVQQPPSSLEERLATSEFLRTEKGKKTSGIMSRAAHFLFRR